MYKYDEYLNQLELRYNLKTRLYQGGPIHVEKEVKEDIIIYTESMYPNNINNFEKLKWYIENDRVIKTIFMTKDDKIVKKNEYSGKLYKNNNNGNKMIQTGYYPSGNISYVYNKIDTEPENIKVSSWSGVGPQINYHENGQISKIYSSSIESGPFGICVQYFENGTIYKVSQSFTPEEFLKYEEEYERVLTLNRIDGSPIIVNGNGYIKRKGTMRGVEYIFEEGEYKNGLKDGLWIHRIVSEFGNKIVCHGEKTFNKGVLINSVDLNSPYL